MATPPTPATIDLVYPVEVDGRQVSQLIMRPPLVRDIRDAQRGGGGSADVEIRLFSLLCEVSPATIEVIHARDYRRIGDVYADFLEGRDGGG